VISQWIDLIDLVRDWQIVCLTRSSRVKLYLYFRHRGGCSSDTWL